MYIYVYSYIMELLLGMLGFVLIIIIVEYIYWCKYVPNMRNAALKNYEDL